MCDEAWQRMREERGTREEASHLKASEARNSRRQLSAHLANIWQPNGNFLNSARLTL